MPQERDFVHHPYSADEQRVVTWLRARTPDVGAGDDPIGFLLASYEQTHDKQVRLREALSEVWDWIRNWNPPMEHDDEWPATAAKVREALEL